LNKTAVFYAPAKINLALHITGKRPDGYHTLKTVMQSISLCDIVTVTLTENAGKIEISCTDKTIPCDEKNIAYKAAEVYFSETKIQDKGAKVHIEKHIPSQAGLGGGSADGAAVFAALNKLCGDALTVDELCKIAAKVGADVPFCIKGGTALCEGIGEIITPMPPLPKCNIVIGKGETGVSTKDAYTAIDALESTAACDFDITAFDGQIHPLEQIASACSNIFELVINNPEIKQIKEIMLAHGAYCAVMSGSGSAVYGIFDFADEDKAEKCRAELERNGFFGEKCLAVERGVREID
jgi:4-diphosphocytidyl-2-C-methyl-D-erythritol kinase